MGDYYDSLHWKRLAASVVTGSSCVACGSTRDLAAHHKMPRIYGGADTRENLEPVCARCHPRREAVARARARVLGLTSGNPLLDALARRRVGATSPPPDATRRLAMILARGR